MTIFVKVKPNASFNKIIPINKNQLEVFITAPAKNGKANEALIKILAEYFAVAPSSISLIKGLKSRNKIFEIN
ncbi:MAG TPA: DUF167 domain-containing protein [Candidatus Paceibacterota bacterium]|jgi:hypothetical protein|nr:DUF167 domain-containing protein [Parcubacteria group bacterium]HRR95094.1 DUF167 domain-containing protein [Candidatus Paceibacterota bacterium]